MILILLICAAHAVVEASPIAAAGGLHALGPSSSIDALYEAEVAPRFGAGEHYLDYTGSGLYLNSLARENAADLLGSAFGNPHSVNPSSQRTTQAVESIRSELLEFFSADPEHYQLVFVRSATGALQALGESFPWTRDSRFAYLVSNHNSVLGIREYARRYGAAVGAVEEAEVEAWLQAGQDPASPEDEEKPAPQGRPAYSLFAYPAQDNFAGVLYPLRWVKQAQAASTRHRRWKVLLDAAAFVPSHRLNLTQVPADFVCVSFYKMFGLPTGVGAWIIRTDDDDFLRRVYWAGGSVFTATSTLLWHLPRHLPARFEDGTLPFLEIIALRHGLRVYTALGGIDAVEAHVMRLAELMSDELAALRHSNGRPLVRLFGKHDAADRAHVQGATANFELLKPDGSVFSYKTAALELADAGFHIRDGCMCNPGSCYGATGVRDREVRRLALDRRGNFTDWEWTPEGRPLGSLRASLGYMSRRKDVHALVAFLRLTYVDRSDDHNPEPERNYGPGWC